MRKLIMALFAILLVSPHLYADAGTYPIMFVAANGSTIQLKVLVDDEGLKDYRLVGSDGLTLFYPTRNDSFPLRTKNYTRTLVHLTFSDLDFARIFKQIQKTFSFQVINRDTGQLIDQRQVSTLDLNDPRLRFGVTSCLSDSHEFEDIASDMWESIYSRDIAFLTSLDDHVYVDSYDRFSRSYARNSITEMDILDRYIEATEANPGFRHPRLIPILSSFGDHDTGKNDATSSAPHMAYARTIFKSFYFPTDFQMPEYHAGPGASYAVDIAGKNFVFLDSRSFRQPHKSVQPNAHLGESQTNWVQSLLENNPNRETYFFKGDQFSPDWYNKESWAYNHPSDFEDFLEMLGDYGISPRFFSGDIHHAEAVPLPKDHRQLLGKATHEVSAGALYSIKNPLRFLKGYSQRSSGTHEYNFVRVEPDGNALNIQAIGQNSEILFSDTLPKVKRVRRQKNLCRRLFRSF